MGQRQRQRLLEQKQGRDVGGKGLKAIADETRAMVSAAQSGSLAAEQAALGTFTIANLGMYGVKSFAPIVQTPQACMLALGAATERVVPREGGPAEDGQVYQLSQVLTATLSCDHRVVDGAVGAQWLAAFKSLVENPLTMLL